MIKNYFKELLVQKQYLVNDANVETALSDLNKLCNDKAYMNAYLLCNFGIAVDKPGLLTDKMVEAISTLYKLEVPASFYANPQDTKYFTKSELLIEQLVSYFLVETGTGIYTRPEIFEKDLPEYKVGTELKLRKFVILSEDEAIEVLKEMAKSLADYTRPFSAQEQELFYKLYEEDYMPEDCTLKCRDNIMAMLEYNVNFVKFLDKKDIVKLSLQYFGEKKTNLAAAIDGLDEARKRILKLGVNKARNCPLSKKQAKYFNKLIAILGDKDTKRVEANSPYKKATALLAKHDVIGAAKVYAANGSLLQRNLKMLLSRANPKETIEILDMLPVKNPIVLLQLISGLGEAEGTPRTFTFTANKKVKKHIETEYETKWRKSRLSAGTVKYLRDVCIDKVYDFYKSLPKLGKVYINPIFYKIGLPTNTSAMGGGIDVVPTGTRLPIDKKFVRTFTTWKGIYDVDASISAIAPNGAISVIYFGNYSAKPFGHDILFSGDCRDEHGTEYYDINLQAMKARGFRYLILSNYGYTGDMDKGEIYTGYQLTDSLQQRAWDPKNNTVQYRVFGKSTCTMSYGIDLETMEVIIINQMQESSDRVVTQKDWKAVAKYLDPAFLDINMGKIFEARADEIVEDPAEADYVFDNEYTIPAPVKGVEAKTQTLVRTFDLEKLVSLANEN